MHNNSAKNRIREATCVLLTLSFIAGIFSGCGKSESGGKYKSITGAAVDSCVLSSNSDYELKWDTEANAVILGSLETGKQWSDILYEAYQEGSINATGNSPITITVVDNTTLKWEEIKSYSEAEEGFANTVCKKLDDGIRVTYFFDRYKIAIPIEYRLRGDSLNVSVIASKILEEGDKYKLVSVTLTPNICSVKNSVNGAYMFVPAGCGAIMYAGENADGIRTFSGEVYGADASRQKPNNFTNDESVLLPVFGVVDEGTAMLGIIENGAGSAFIDAQAGNARLGYSTAGVTFYVRGFDEFRFASLGTGNITTRRIADELCDETLSVGYYPLYGENANYNGMAERYRRYLDDNSLITKNKAEYTPYSISLLGGTEVTKTVMGLPKTGLVAMTTYSQAENIISAVTAKNGVAPVVRMMYYGDRGITPGTIGAGFSSVYGSKKELNALNSFCRENNVLMFMDSEIVEFTKSGNGVSVNSGSAKNAIKHTAERHPFSPIRYQDEDSSVYVISRSKLDAAANKSIKKALQLGFDGISFSTLGSIAFSDYADGTKYANKRGIEKQTEEILKSAADKGMHTAAAGANSYAAAAADVLFDVTIDNGAYDAFDAQIPFYQVVFGSFGPMYTKAVNVSENSAETVMWAAASGMGLGFSLCGSYTDESDDLAQHKLYATLYEDNTGLINDTLVSTGFKDCFNATGGSGLASYDMLDGGVSKSTFRNGTVLYANHNSSPAMSPVGELSAYGFRLQ